MKVAVGIIFDKNHRVLIAERPHHVSYAGWWEFPGGKLEIGEDSYAALCRELREEIGIQVANATFLLEMDYEYKDQTVHLHYWRVDDFLGEVKGCENQKIEWILLSELSDFKFLPANQKIVEYLNSTASQGEF